MIVILENVSSLKPDSDRTQLHTIRILTHRGWKLCRSRSTCQPWNCTMTVAVTLPGRANFDYDRFSPDTLEP